MARKYKRLNYEDRKAIEAMCKQGKRAEEIAEAMDVHRATIYHELKRGGAENGNRKQYSADMAQKAYNLFPEKDRGSTYERRKNMKLNIKKFMMTEMGGELEETIKAWDQALEERRKATPGIGDPDQGIGFGYWDRTRKSCQDRWEVFKLAIRQFYGIEFNFTRTDEYFGICNDDETIWLMKENREEERQ